MRTLIILFQITMNTYHVMTFVALAVCCGLLVVTALPIDLDEMPDMDTEEIDSCTLCYAEDSYEACIPCQLENGAVKRGGPVYHPLFRGIFPKRSQGSYGTYYSPLTRGSYHKKSPYPVYHPFLRGGYSNPYAQTYDQPWTGCLPVQVHWIMWYRSCCVEWGIYSQTNVY